MSRFKGQAVIVTGGALGIGGATARKFAKEGAKVLIADFNEVAATNNVELILSQGGIAAFSHTDVSKSEDVERMIQEAIRQFGGVDVLVQNAFSVIAGENHIHGSAVSVKEESWDYGMDVMLSFIPWRQALYPPHATQAVWKHRQHRLSSQLSSRTQHARL